MFSNGKSLLVQPIQRDELITNEIDCRLIDIQQKVIDLLSAGYVIYDVASATNNNFNNLIASSSGNRICIWKSAGSTAYTIYSTELASNGTNVIINATLNNMNQVTAIRDCMLTCTASSGLFANKAEFYGGDWYLNSWTTGSNVKFTNCNIYAYTSEVYMPDVRFEYCNFNFKRSGTIAYSTYKQNIDTNFVNATTAGSTNSTITLSYAYTTESDWFLRCTIKDFKTLGNAVISSTASRTFNFTGLKIDNSDLTMTNVYTTEGNKIYYEGQGLNLIGSAAGLAWANVGSTNVSSSSGLYPSLAFNQSGIPYVAFQDNSTSASGKAACYKYGSTGWQTVGNYPLSTNTMDYINLHISTSNDLIVVGRDNSSKAICYIFNVSNSSWVALGGGSFSTNQINSVDSKLTSGLPAYGYHSHLSVVTVNSSSNSKLCDLYIYPKPFWGSYSSSGLFSNREWYSGYGTTNIYNYNLIDAKITNFNGYVGIITVSSSSPTIINIHDAYQSLEYDTTGGIRPTWPDGASTFMTITSTVGNITKLFVDKNNNKDNNDMAYMTSSSILNYIKFNYGYGVFGNQVPTTSSENYGISSTGSVQNASISKISSIPYVAIQDTTAKATVYKYVVSNSSWNLVGLVSFSTDNVGRLSLNSYNNVPYLAFEEKAAPGINLMKYDEVSSVSNINYSFEYLETDLSDAEKVLDITSIQTTSNYIVQNCNIKPIFNIRDTAVGRFITNSYNIELSASWNPTVNETLKQTNADTFWIVKREDIENTLNGKIIKNLKLYDSGLYLYTYNSNDNFIIIANSASKGNAVFCYYNNKIRGTVFSDNYFDESYTITNCFVLMEVAEINEFQNVVSSTALTDGPLLSGSIMFNSYDNEIIL